MKFFISCHPPKTTAQQKKLGTFAGKAMMFTPAKTRATGEMLTALLSVHTPMRPLEGPLRLTVTYRWPWRNADPQKVRSQGWAWMWSRPDCSNLIKQIEDCMTGLRFWRDDGQIAELIFRKQRGEQVGIEIEIEPLTP